MQTRTRKPSTRRLFAVYIDYAVSPTRGGSSIVYVNATSKERARKAAVEDFARHGYDFGIDSLVEYHGEAPRGRDGVFIPIVEG